MKTYKQADFIVAQIFKRTFDMRKSLANEGGLPIKLQISQ